MRRLINVQRSNHFVISWSDEKDMITEVVTNKISKAFY